MSPQCIKPTAIPAAALAWLWLQTIFTLTQAKNECQAKDDSYLLQVQTSPRKRQTHIGVAVDLGPSHEHILEYIVMLHSSWQHVVSHDDKNESNALVDLLVSCEDCRRLPLECLSMVDSDHRLIPYVPSHRCLYTENKDPDIDYFKKMQHPAMLSVSFLTMEPMKSMVSRYDWILRSDEDAFISPRILSWRPPHGMVFGSAGVQTAWTNVRLENISRELGLEHRGVHNICSGWFVPSNLAVELAVLATNVSKHLLENEYGYRADTGYMADKVKLGGLEWWKEGNLVGEWPKFWRGVTSLYASNIAINHLVKDLTSEMVTTDIDFSTTDHGSVWDHVHLHVIQGNHGFNKFRFFEEVEQKGAATSVDMDMPSFMGHLEAMDDELIAYWQSNASLAVIYGDVPKYATWIASRSMSGAASVFKAEPETIAQGEYSIEGPRAPDDSDSNPTWYKAVSLEDAAKVIHVEEPAA